MNFSTNEHVTQALNLGLVPETAFATELGWSVRTLRRAGQVSDMPLPIRVGSRRFFVAEEVATWLENQKQERNRQAEEA